MTKDDIIRMAFKYTVGGLEFDEKGLLRFVDIITAAEREACAVIAFNAKTYIEAAAAIRARSNYDKLD